MTRTTVVLVHAVALPVAGLLALALVAVFPTTISKEAVEVALQDTYFVVAHFHATSLLSASVLVASFVAYRYGHLNWLFGVAWAFLVVHLITLVFPWATPAAAAPEPDTFNVLLPTHPGSLYIHVGSALAGLLATLLGLIMSLIRALKSQAARQA